MAHVDHAKNPGLLSHAFGLEKSLSLLPFAWTKTIAQGLATQREAFLLAELGGNLELQAQRLVDMGYHTYFAKAWGQERMNDPQNYIQDVIHRACEDLAISEVKQNVKDGLEPVLVDTRMENCETIAQSLGISIDEIKKTDSPTILFGMMPVDRGLRYLKPKKKSDVYIAWLKKRHIGDYGRSTYIEIEDRLDPHERMANLAETFAYYREHPELRDDPFLHLHAMGERYYANEYHHQFSLASDFKVPVIDTDGSDYHVMMNGNWQTGRPKNGIFLTTPYRPEKLVTHADPIRFPRR